MLSLSRAAATPHAAMDSLKTEHEKLQKKGNLNKSINDVQKTIDLLLKARAQIAEGAFALCQLAFAHI